MCMPCMSVNGVFFNACLLIEHETKVRVLLSHNMLLRLALETEILIIHVYLEMESGASISFYKRVTFKETKGLLFKKSTTHLF
jgi:hypothetical protein